MRPGTFEWCKVVRRWKSSSPARLRQQVPPQLSKVGNREALVDRLWSALEALPDPQPSRPSKQADVIGLLRRPEGVTVDEVRAATGWQPHTVRGVFSGALKKKLGLAVIATKEERGRVYRIAEAGA